jgi:hypothetical protein
VTDRNLIFPSALVFCWDSGKHADALKSALSFPPYGCQNDAIKERSYGLVFTCLQGIKGDQVARATATLTNEECDALIKYIYRGLANDDTRGSADPMAKQQRTTTCATLLAWHAAVREKAGLGVLVRATTGYPL